jgi:periplasmic protein TonB
MNATALYLPERRGLSRWMLAAIAILMAHAAIVAAIASWYARRPVEPNILPAIAVTLAPVEASSPAIEQQDVAIGPPMQQAEAAPPEPPKVEEKPLEKVEMPPAPPQQAEVTLPQVAPKEEPKPEQRPPAPEDRALPREEHVGKFTQAGSNAYNSLVLGHLRRFMRYPKEAHSARGKVGVRFVLNRAGEIIESSVTKSSGKDVLDRAALEILHRASPFPKFPTAKPGEQDIYLTLLNFDVDK